MLSNTFERYLERRGLVPEMYSGTMTNGVSDDGSERIIGITVNDYTD
jgi:hypothetical protein